MQNRTKREIGMIVFGVIFVIAAVVYVMMPPSTAGGRRGQLSLREAQDKSRSLDASIRQMSRDKSQMGPRIARMIYREPAEELLPRIIKNLQASADKSGVHLREVKPLRPRLIAGGAGTRVPMEVRFRATFQPNVVKFFYFVEDPDSRMVLDKINISSADAKFKTVDVAVQITVYTRSTVGITGSEGGETSDAKAKKS